MGINIICNCFIAIVRSRCSTNCFTAIVRSRSSCLDCKRHSTLQEDHATMSGASNSNLEAVAEEFRNTLTAYMAHNYDLEEVRKMLINFDEVVIKYESVDFKGKKVKSTLNVIVGTAMNGDKFKPVIGKGFLGVNLDTPPVHYYKSDNAWMTWDIFCHWFINHFLPEVRIKYGPHQIVVVLIDNHPAHPHDLDDLDPQVEVQFLPWNTTDLIQPMDQGIISDLKSNVKRLYSEELVYYCDYMHDYNREDPYSANPYRSFLLQYTIYDVIQHIGQA